jgi:hypothetical protein
VRLSADIKWTGCSSIERMRNHLSDFTCCQKSNLKKIFKGQAPPAYDRVEVSVKCGKVAGRSSFIFLRRPRNKSQIIGVCSTNQLVDLIDDFDFLKLLMDKSNLTFSVSDPKVTLDGNKFIEKTNRGFSNMKSVLADFLGMVGFISGATSYLLFGEANQITVIFFILGLIFWTGSVIIGRWNRPKYLLIEQE